MSQPRLAPAISLLAALLSAAPASHASGAFQGQWCGNGMLKDYSLRLGPGERRDEVEGFLTRKNKVREIHGTVEGSTLRTQSTKIGSLVLAAMSSELKIVDGDGPAALLKGYTFRRASAQGCGR